jgi:gluconolactonase
VATLINGGMTVVSPGVKLIHFVALDDKYTTNLCFGGVERRTVFVMLSMTCRIIGLDWPRQGLPTHFTA